MDMPASAIEVVESGRLAHLVTINPDGSPQVTIVWTGWDATAAQIVVGKLSVDQKVRNLRRDPRVALSIEADGSHLGMGNYLVVEGTAEVVPGGAPALLQDLAHRYVGPDARFPPMDDPPEGFTIRITPTKVRGMGPWSAPAG